MTIDLSNGTKTCRVCLQAYARKTSLPWSKWSRSLFCGDEHRRAASGPSVKTCVVCERDFLRGSKNSRQWGMTNCCSRSCGYAFRKSKNRDAQGRRLCSTCRISLTPENSTRSDTHCRQCRSTQQKLGKTKQPWFVRAHSSLGVGARRRAIPFNISAKDILDQFERQGGVCAYSGVKMTIKEYGVKRGTDASIDRVDNSVGYEPGNIKAVCRALNVAKMDMPLSEFVGWCKSVASFIGGTDER